MASHVLVHAGPEPNVAQMPLAQASLLVHGAPSPPRSGAQTEVVASTGRQEKPEGHGRDASQNDVQNDMPPAAAHMRDAHSSFVRQASPSPAARWQEPQSALTPIWQVVPSGHPLAPPGMQGVAHVPSAQKSVLHSVALPQGSPRAPPPGAPGRQSPALQVPVACPLQ